MVGSSISDLGLLREQIGLGFKIASLLTFVVNIPQSWAILCLRVNW